MMATKAKRAKARPRAKPAPRKSSIAIKRVYEDASPGDGLRILIDRLWPRGMSKASLKYDEWVRDLAPSNELRKWYNHDPKRAAEFRRRYRHELAPRREELAALRARLKGHKATLLTATRELELSHANVLRGLLEKA
jgi:uncharacterized protein YeaO (DUF488 family)